MSALENTQVSKKTKASLFLFQVQVTEQVGPLGELHTNVVLLDDEKEKNYNIPGFTCSSFFSLFDAQ